MTKPVITYIATSKAKEIRGEGIPTYHWDTTLPWTKFKSPVAYSNKKVKYDKTLKNKVGKSKYGGLGGGTHYGTYIPATKQVTIAGATVAVDVRYYQRGYTIYTRTSALKADKKMRKTTYTASKPYQYRIQLKDRVTYDRAYSQFVDGYDRIYFANFYYDGHGRQTRNKHFAHPTEANITHSDIRRNQDTSNANNSDDRDNYGKYILKNVRTNVVSLDLKWEGLSASDGEDLLDTLSPTKKHPYLIVQYFNAIDGGYKNGTFYVSDRQIEMHPSGIFKSIEVTLTEV